MSKKRLAVASALILALLFVMSGCNTPVQVGSVGVDEGEYYTLQLGSWNNSWEWVVDRSGATVLAPEPEPMVLKDILTGAPQCQVRVRYEETERVGGTLESQAYSALYDLEGNLLQDWGAYYYNAGFGDFLIRQATDIYSDTDGDTALWNYKTGEDHLTGVVGLEALGEDSVLLFEKPWSLLGVVDSEGEVVSGVPSPVFYPYARAWNGYIIAGGSHSMDWESPSYKEENILLTKELEPIAAYEWLYGNNLAGNVLEFRDGERQGLLSVPDLEEVFLAPPKTYIGYYDQELAQLSREYVGGQSRMFLSDIGGAPLTEDYKSLEPENAYWEDGEPAQFFVGAGEDAVERIDRTGKVVASVDIPGVEWVSRLGEGLVLYSARGEKYNYYGVLDSELKGVVPANKYQYLYLWSNYEGTDLLVGEKLFEDSNLYRIDVMTLGGKVLVENITQLHDAGQGRLAVTRGFSAGLMDWEGNWIVKRSIFGRLEDE